VLNENRDPAHEGARSIGCVARFATGQPQGTRAGYERAARFLTDDLERSVQPADIRPICVQGLTTSGIGNPGGMLNSNW